jgi:hypothetical protein
MQSFTSGSTYSGKIFVTELELGQQKERIQRRRLCFMRTDIPQPKPLAGKEMLLLPSGRLITTASSDPFNERKEKYRDWTESPQVFAEYGDYVLQMEAPASSDEEF